MAYKPKSIKDVFAAPPITASVDAWQNQTRHCIFKTKDDMHPISRKILRSVTDTLTPTQIYSDYHYHEGVEIFRILEGGAEMVIDNHPIRVEKGDIIIINPFVAHGTYLYAENNTFSRSCIMFHPYHIFPAEGGRERFFGNLKTLCFEAYIPHSHPNNPELSESIDRIIALFSEKPPAWTVSAYAEVMHFYALMTQHGLYREPQSNNPYLFEFMHRVSSYIEDHLDEDISTADIAAHCQYTPEHFCRIFKKCFDKTFKDYLNIYRIQKAREFMESGSYETLSQISSKCGFNNQNHFSHMFKKYVGILPSEYTRTHSGHRKEGENSK